MKEGYGDRCNARFWLEPHEHACCLEPGHDGEHAFPASEMFEHVVFDRDLETLRWASNRPGVMSLLGALRAANYDESGAEYLRRIVTGRGQDGERSEPPPERRVRVSSLTPSLTREATNLTTEPVRVFVPMSRVESYPRCPVCGERHVDDKDFHT